jgi:pSer/pThr/pTyr-binding forkhead associated (FHA) protein
VSDDELNDLVNQLRLSGVVRADRRQLVVRNRIYEQIFDQKWIASTKPIAELQISDGRKVRLRGASTLGRTEANDVALPDAKVSRRHAVIHRQGPSELWLADLGSRNGTFLNGTRILVPTLLSDQDRNEIGPYRQTFRQPSAPKREGHKGTTVDRTVFEE